MNQNNFTKAVSMRDIVVTDEFWKHEMELVREEVIPYQWDALNDQVEGAAPSYCMHNFKTAAKLNQDKEIAGKAFKEPVYTFRGFESLPQDPKNPDDNFYGFVFQDSDFYKWIEAVAYSLINKPDEELEKLADEAIDVVCQAQQEDGYLDTYYILNGKDKIFTNLKDHHELYCLGHLLEGAVAYYEATGKDKLLKAAMGYADYAAAHLGTEAGKKKGYPGHEIAEMALIRLYEVTKDEKYLHLSRYFLEQRGQRPYYFDEEHPEERGADKTPDWYHYYQAHRPVKEQEEAVGHAVRAVYLYSGMTDVARLTQDEKMWDACEKLWDSVTREKMYITGGIGGTHIGESFSFPYDLPNDTAYAETCASIGLMFWAKRMLMVKADRRYSDAMELALYNTVLSGMALDGKSFFYVNPLEVNPEACHRDERKAHVKPVRQKWFGCACCPPNLARVISSISSYAYTQREDALFVHLYMGSTVNLGDCKVRVDAHFPWDGNVRICMEECSEKEFTLALRIPVWCEDYEISGAGEDATRCMKDGYLYLTKVWDKGDVISLNLFMQARVLQASTRVREDIGKVAIMRGPVVYCVEEVDNGSDLHMLTIEPGAGLDVDNFQIQGNKMKSIILKGYRQTLEPEEDGSLYHTYHKINREAAMIHLIPYYAWANRGENEMMVWLREN